jgi:predicted glycogen debranching enzyme
MRTTLVGWKKGDPQAALLTREWLVSNALGGYASGTIGGACTRRFHGLLIAALAAPLGRTMMLNHLLETVTLADGRVLALGGDDRVEGTALPDLDFLSEFRLEHGLPVWRYEHDGVLLEKRLVLPHLQNTAVLVYRLLASPAPLELRVRPSFQIRLHEGPVDVRSACPYVVRVERDRCEVRGEDRFPPLRLRMTSSRPSPRPELVLDGGSERRVRYRIERARGYDHEGPLESPGYYRAVLHAGDEVTLLASVESWEAMGALTAAEAFHAENERRDRLIEAAHPKARTGVAAQLVLAADQFIITPQTRVVDSARAHAVGDEARTVIAGYHWFTDWGRDTMISLEGLTLVTGRHVEAGYILRTFARHVKDGLIPNMFPEGEKEGLYHTADATLWFFHAVHRYVMASNDHVTLRAMLPIFKRIVAHHVQGTHFGIGVDPRDGLLRQGAEGYQLTWMDAKVGDWVVTPRRGKAVELNALFFNAVKLLEGWVREAEGPAAAQPYAELSARTQASFNARFWNDTTNHLYDVVDGPEGDDPRLRPNQLFAIALDHPVLDPARWRAVVGAARAALLTPVGLRSLGPAEPDYQSRYDGELRARDAAYHQGTVWGWLVGPFVDAWLKVHPDDRKGARAILHGFGPHLAEEDIGSISEIFDAEDPFTPRGCVAQAWSVAEVLRCLVKVEE